MKERKNYDDTVCCNNTIPFWLDETRLVDELGVGERSPSGLIVDDYVDYDDDDCYMKHICDI